jgi:hypothetical protein
MTGSIDEQEVDDWLESLSRSHVGQVFWFQNCLNELRRPRRHGASCAASRTTVLRPRLPRTAHRCRLIAPPSAAMSVKYSNFETASTSCVDRGATGQAARRPKPLFYVPSILLSRARRRLKVSVARSLFGRLLGGPSVGFVAGFSVGSRMGLVSCRALDIVLPSVTGSNLTRASCSDELARFVADSERQVRPRPLLVYYYLA